MNAPLLPADIDVATFDTLHDDVAAWGPMVTAVAAAIPNLPGPLQPVGSGTVFVALLGDSQVLKLYPPFLHDHFAFECAALAAIGGGLSIPTPRLLQTGACEGWPWLVMSQLFGEPLTGAWPALLKSDKCRLLHTLGALAAEVHRLPAAALAAHAPRWADFIAKQRTGCVGRQQRTGLPAHLLERLPAFLDGPLPQGLDVILTGEYTPMNLLVHGARLSGMFDFGDGLVGPAPYDWLGPLTFLAAGSAARCNAFFNGYGRTPDRAQRLALMRLLLLHRYSHFQAQIALPGWQAAPDFEALTERLWPM